jgi:cyclic beta-1,2-glucan synthetase
VFSIRRRIQLKPGGRAIISLATAVAASRSAALAIADQYRDPAAATRVFELAWARSQVQHRHEDRLREEAHVYERLASHLLFAGTALRADPPAISGNRLDQSGLWRFGLSGDRPILLARFRPADDLQLARELLAAHSYLRSRGLNYDTVILVEEPGGYSADLYQRLVNLAGPAGSSERPDQPRAVFVLKITVMSDDEVRLVEAAARVVLSGANGSLAGQLVRTQRRPALPELLTVEPRGVTWQDEVLGLPSGLLFANGLGGFSADGREYCLLVSCDPRAGSSESDRTISGAATHPRLAPAPWINVVANPAFGFQVSESGAGFTWSMNSQMNRLTPWHNDPVSDTPGEVVYIRDDETGETWCPTPLPILTAQPTRVSHGQGYSTFERNTHGLNHALTMFVPPDDSIKLIRLRIRNAGKVCRRLSATYYAEWVLGTARDVSSMHVVTEVDADTGALLARNAFRMDFGHRVAFADVDRRPRTLTADRTEFIGRHGSLAAPAALGRRGLSGYVGAALDPCAAIQVPFDLEPGTQVQLVFVLGETDGVEAARKLILRYRVEGAVDQVLLDVRREWDEILGTVQIQTPDSALDLLFNRWLLYQVLSCRVWARTAFYQSGGAFGFRDQLQDVMALVHAAPALARAHIVQAASRQFSEGDVQHWWHPPKGRGIRTRISDDALWLPFVTSQYVSATGDSTILDERIPFLDAPALRPGQVDEYGSPAPTEGSVALYDHCMRALQRAGSLGVHGLPLIGCGDWNDGMNRVGRNGKGESVWLAWFSICCFNQFAQLCESRGETTQAALLRERAHELQVATETNAWDGRWYRRAYFDDGTPLGSAQNKACSIDSLAQSWAVISGSADRDRAKEAIQAVHEQLVLRDDGLILLFAPAFQDDESDPGYVRGYLPGVRENGGQYTHAAVWVVQATALLGRGKLAFELLRMINPVLHASDARGVERYQVEPYVLAGDVYSYPPHVGRGGWTWYTGSAGWVYRVILTSLLGADRLGHRLVFNPRIPPDWSHFEIRYRFGTATYVISVENPDGGEFGVAAVWHDEEHRHDNSIVLQDDGQVHQVRVVLAPS